MATTHRVVFLKKVATGEPQEAELLDGINARHLTDVDEIWRPALSLLARWSGRESRQESSNWNGPLKMRQIRLN